MNGVTVETLMFSSVLLCIWPYRMRNGRHNSFVHDVHAAETTMTTMFHTLSTHTDRGTWQTSSSFAEGDRWCWYECFDCVRIIIVWCVERVSMRLWWKNPCGNHSNQKVFEVIETIIYDSQSMLQQLVEVTWVWIVLVQHHAHVLNSDVTRNTSSVTLNVVCTECVWPRM